MEDRIELPASEMPRQWYNVLPDLPEPLAPPLNPATGELLTPDMLAPIFPESLIAQEMASERWIDIPEEVLDVMAIWRPSPLRRARRLEQYLDTPAKIYWKDESVSPAGSHKPNTAIAQAYFNKKEGVKRLTTETGAGQWGSALSFSTAMLGLECTVYMVKISYQQKPYRQILMRTWGGECIPSPSDRTKVGRAILEKNPDSPGSLGMAISEAVEDAVTRDDSKYCLGSVLNHVLLHQTIIGLEAKKQFEQVGDYPDVVIGCVGGGSNFGGLVLPFIHDKLAGDKPNLRAVAVEPESCPTLTKGLYAYDYGDTGKMTPLLLMYTLGHGFVPPPVHAGGLRYHGVAPIIANLAKHGLIEATSYQQNPVFEAAVTWARVVGTVPAPETSHAIRAAIDEALRCKETGEAKTILIGYSGHGLLDLAAYDAYLSGNLPHLKYEEEDLQRALNELPKVGENQA